MSYFPITIPLIDPNKYFEYAQANRAKRSYSSQYSLDSIGTVPDLTDRVIRVSFAPTGGPEDVPTRGGESVNNEASNQVPESENSDRQTQETSNDSLDQDSVSAISIGRHCALGK